MADQPAGREKRGLLSRLTGAWSPGGAQPGRPQGGDDARPSKVLPKFLACLAQRPAPVLLDLGPAIGSNVSFLGERLGCKIFIEDLYADLERHRAGGGLESFRDGLDARFALSEASVDGVLCWDVFDYLDAPTAQALGKRVGRLVKPGGAIFGFFSTAASDEPGFVRYQIASETTLLLRPIAGGYRRRLVVSNRNLDRLFEGLRVSESFLLLSSTREVLLRKGSG